MSWESVAEIDRPCPCGRGTYTAITEVDDWNRSRSDWRMNCSRCREDYIRHDYPAHDSGIAITAHRWVRKSTYAQYEKLKNQAEDHVAKAQKLSETRYLARWEQFFYNRNKKECWSILTNAGARYPALGTFYKHVRDEGISKYLQRFFRNDNERALTILDVDDAEIRNLRTEAATLMKKATETLRAD